jgi:molecular chaperone Hsp33
MLKGLGRAEIDSIIAEQGAVTVICEFRHRPYRFDPFDAERLFVDLPAGEGSGAVN